MNLIIDDGKKQDFLYKTLSQRCTFIMGALLTKLETVSDLFDFAPTSHSF